MADELPIFFDKTGRRWKLTKIAFVIIFLLLAISIVLLTQKILQITYKPPINESIGLPNFATDTRSPSDIAYTMQDDLPILGSGVFLRVLKLHSLDNSVVAADVFTGETVKVLSEDEKIAAGDSEFIIEKYGSKSGKFIVLTFDDGPHPIYTPQVLDVLSAEQAHSTFYPTAVNIVKYPEVTERMAREGHDVANHTFTHADLDLISSLQAEQEINQTQRIINSVTKTSTALFRIPYGGGDTQSILDDKRAILEGQKQGYVVSSYDIDTNDWGFDHNTKIELPELDGTNKVFLLHDGGGDRSLTVTYLRELIQSAKKSGYEFTSLSRLFNEYQLSQPITPSKADRASYVVSNAVIVLPRQILSVLFMISVVLTFIGVVVSIVLAELQIHFHKPKRRKNNFYPLVSVVIPAYNEVKVIKKTVSSVLRSSYRNLEIIVVDDGSKDGTWQLVKKIIDKNNRVKGISQRNAGKASAVNKGIKKAKGEIIISIDADTIFMSSTVGKLTRYFHNPKVGAVAGVVKVGNINSWITRWQALEYITSINIERAAQAFLKSIVIAPGACSAWRKRAIIEAGGYSGATMAEDCDLTLAVHKAGYEVLQDFGAVALTESPETMRDISKQRFRWLFGTLQSYWKHRDVFFRKKYRWLGFYVMPRSVFGILMQIIFTPLLLIVAIANIAAGNLNSILLFSAVAFGILVFYSLFALILAHEKYRHILATPGFRLVYSPLRSILLYATAIAVLGGLQTGWNKVVRHGSVTLD